MNPQVRESDLVREDFLRGMRYTAASVCVVATNGIGGLYGATVSAMCSVSADPPTLLVCLHRQSRCGQAVLLNEAFSLNVLGPEQRRIAETFAGQTGSKGSDKFQTCSWHTTASGSPAIDGSTAVFDCTVDRSVTVGSHYTIFGSVLCVDTTSEFPLIYHNQSYRNLYDPGKINVLPVD